MTFQRIYSVGGHVRPVLEICVDSLESAVAAEAGGADRLELCSALAEGGVTPSLGLIRAVRSRVSVALHVIIRPRSGDFLYSAPEFALMRDDIAIAREAGADGVVFGLLDIDGAVDVEATRALVECAHPMEVTFHRAFDMACDLHEALSSLVATGVHRVLTSGGEQTAMMGRECLARLVSMAGEQIIVMVAGGVQPGNIAELAHATGAREFHASLRGSVASPMRYQAQPISLGEPGADEYVRKIVRMEDVNALKRAANGPLFAH